MKLKAIAAIAAAAPLMVACGAQETAKFTLNGAGATFPSMLYQNWFQSFAKDTGNQVNYQAVGSGAGVRQFKAKTVDFGKTTTFEKIGCTEEFQKNMTFRKDRTPEKFWGVQTFGISMLFWKTEFIRKFREYRAVLEKHVIQENRGIREIRGYADIRNFHVLRENTGHTKIGLI